MNSRDIRGRNYIPRMLASSKLIISRGWAISKRGGNIKKKTRSGRTHVSGRIEESIKSIFLGKKGKSFKWASNFFDKVLKGFSDNILGYLKKRSWNETPGVEKFPS